MSEYKSTELNELLKAISMAQSEINVALKSSSNPFFKSSYANLQSIIEASRPALCKHGLSVIQQMVTDNGSDYLVTILGHASGQWISSRMKIAPQKTDVQSLGSYITYLRRYMYAALVGVYDGEDDDGESHRAAETVRVDTVTPAEAKSLYHGLNTIGRLDAILKAYNIANIAQLKRVDAPKVIEYMNEMFKNQQTK
jgi:hypothetical protein